MKQLLVAIGITILTSLFFFPFNTVWLPAVNTKMALAALAIPLFFIRGAQSRNSIPAYGMIGLSVCLNWQQNRAIPMPNISLARFTASDRECRRIWKWAWSG